jgi:hypothetical protein
MGIEISQKRNHPFRNLVFSKEAKDAVTRIVFSELWVKLFAPNNSSVEVW